MNAHRKAAVEASEVATDRVVPINLKVKWVRIQKDEYRMSDGATIGDAAFWRSEENEAEVGSFKRAKASCVLTVDGQAIDFELIANLRSNNLRLILKGSQMPADQIAAFLRPCLGALFHRPGFKPAGVLVPLFSRDPSKTLLCKTYDAHWVAAVLKDIGEEKEGLPFAFTEKQLSE